LFSAFPFHPISAICLLFTLCFQKEKEQKGKKTGKEKHPETTYLQGKFKTRINLNKTQPVFVPILWL